MFEQKKFQTAIRFDHSAIFVIRACFEFRNSDFEFPPSRAVLVHVVNLDQTDSGAAVLPGQDGGEPAGGNCGVDA
jgi:hypothetical protein